MAHPHQLNRKGKRRTEAEGEGGERGGSGEEEQRRPNSPSGPPVRSPRSGTLFKRSQRHMRRFLPFERVPPEPIHPSSPPSRPTRGIRSKPRLSPVFPSSPGGFRASPAFPAADWSVCDEGASFMRVDGGLAGRNGWELTAGAGLAAEKANRSSSKKSKRGRQKRPPGMPTLVQKLFDTCREVFADGQAGVVPSPADVERLRSVLDHMSLADVGLSQNMRYFGTLGSAGKPPVTYLHVYECDKFSIGIFCLPPSAVIPLHNHPGMTVFSKLLFGSLHIKSYDWVDNPHQANGPKFPHVQHPGMRLANVKTDATFTSPCNTSILYPAAGGNMHCFTAVTPCAVLDVLGPPYSDPEGRHCTYYNDFPHGTFSDKSVSSPRDGESYAWLEERDKPEDFLVVGAKYGGPRIVESS